MRPHPSDVTRVHQRGGQVYAHEDGVAILWPQDGEWWVGTGFVFNDVWAALQALTPVESGDRVIRPHLTEADAQEAVAELPGVKRCSLPASPTAIPRKSSRSR